MKKVVFCCPSLIMGGAEKVLVAYLNELGKLNKYDIRLVNYEKSDKMFLYSQIKVPFKYFYFDLRKEKPKNFIAKKIWRIKRHYFIKKVFKEADVVIDWLDGGFYRFISDFKRKKISWIHSAYTHFRDNIQKDFSNYDALVCLSDSFKNDLEADEPKMHGIVHRIYNPFDFEKIEQLCENNSLLTLQDKELLKENYYIHLSRIAQDKDLTTLIFGYKEFIQKTHLTDKLYIVGSGELETHYQSLIQKEGMEKQIQMLGQKNNPYPFVKKAKALILSSKAEGLPNVIIEAMVCRTPVIASNCKSGIGELCLNGKGGFLYKPGDKEALCQALIDFNKNPEAVKDHVENAQKQLDRFKIENIIPKVEELIDG